MRTEMRGIVCLVLFLLQRVAAFCPEAFTCSATNGVEFDCSSKTAANGFVHCCCSNRGRQCYHLSECYTTTHISCFWQRSETDNVQTFGAGGQYRYRAQMDGSYNYIGVQLQSSNNYVSAYLASGDNCDRWFGDAGFQYKQYLMSDTDTYRWHHDLGAFPASIWVLGSHTESWIPGQVTVLGGVPSTFLELVISVSFEVIIDLYYLFKSVIGYSRE